MASTVDWNSVGAPVVNSRARTVGSAYTVFCVMENIAPHGICSVGISFSLNVNVHWNSRSYDERENERG